MTDSLGSLVENLRPHPSSLRKQVEARHKSAGEFSFYGPAGSDFGQSLCKPRTRDAGHFSPGPARYNYLHMTPELVRHPFASSSAAHASPRSSRRRNACGTSSSACARRGTTSRRAAGAGRASTRARARAERWADLFRRRRERAAARSRRRAPGHAPQPAPREAAGLAELGELQHVRHPEQVHLRAVSPVQLWPVDDARRRVPPRPALPPGDRARRSRPFFDPLPNSCQSTIRERLRRHNPNQP